MKQQNNTVILYSSAIFIFRSENSKFYFKIKINIVLENLPTQISNISDSHYKKLYLRTYL